MLCNSSMNMLFLDYFNGPALKNALSPYCSTEYGNSSWAMTKCQEHDNCNFIHDYGCDGTNWRYCPNINKDQHLNTGSSVEACSWVPEGKKFSSFKFILLNINIINIQLKPY